VVEANYNLHLFMSKKMEYYDMHLLSSSIKWTNQSSI